MKKNKNNFSLTNSDNEIKQSNKKSKEKYIIASMIYFLEDNDELKILIDGVYTGIKFLFTTQACLDKAKYYSSKSYAKKIASEIGKICEIEALRVIPVSELNDYKFYNPLPRHLFLVEEILK